MVEKLLNDYRNITEQMIEQIDNEDIENLVKEREAIISNLKGLDIKEELEKFNKVWDIENHEKLLMRKMVLKREKVKEELDIIKKRRLMRNKYNNGAGSFNYLNRKI